MSRIERVFATWQIILFYLHVATLGQSYILSFPLMQKYHPSHRTERLNGLFVYSAYSPSKKYPLVLFCVMHFEKAVRSTHILLLDYIWGKVLYRHALMSRPVHCVVLFSNACNGFIKEYKTPRRRFSCSCCTKCYVCKYNKQIHKLFY